MNQQVPGLVSCCWSSLPRHDVQDKARSCHHRRRRCCADHAYAHACAYEGTDRECREAQATKGYECIACKQTCKQTRQTTGTSCSLPKSQEQTASLLFYALFLSRRLYTCVRGSHRVVCVRGRRRGIASEGIWTRNPVFLSLSPSVRHAHLSKLQKMRGTKGETCRRRRERAASIAACDCKLPACLPAAGHMHSHTHTAACMPVQAT